MGVLWEGKIDMKKIVELKTYEEKLEELQKILHKFEPGKLPPELFSEMARLTVVPVVEIVPVIFKNNSINILLIQRSSEDAFWPNKYHVPGAVVLATDKEGGFNDALNRISKSKLGNIDISKAKLVGTYLTKVKRGMEVAIVFYISLDSIPENFISYASDNLPSSMMVEGHEKFVKEALTTIASY